MPQDPIAVMTREALSGRELPVVRLWRGSRAYQYQLECMAFTLAPIHELLSRKKKQFNKPALAFSPLKLSMISFSLVILPLPTRSVGSKVLHLFLYLFHDTTIPCLSTTAVTDYYSAPVSRPLSSVYSVMLFSA